MRFDDRGQADGSQQSVSSNENSDGRVDLALNMQPAPGADSQPLAVNDANTLTGPSGPAAGNVMANDTAPNAAVTAISSNNTGASDARADNTGNLQVNGEYGQLRISAEGDYRYTRNAGTPDNVTDLFTYRVTDADGDDASATLAIRILNELVQVADAQRIVPGPDGVVVLPPGVGLEDVRVVGRDLVITLPDGTQMVIVDGAVFVPQLVIDGVNIPPSNLAALLIGQEAALQPAAGPTAPPQSSGGNFEVDVGDIGDPFDLGDLLPPTDFGFVQPPQQEIIPDVADEDPEVIVITQDFPAGAIAATATVNEAGLPARGAEPPGTNAAANSETTTGTIQITAGDAPFEVALNGVLITAVGQTFTSASGVLTITSIGANAVGFSYTLTDNLLNTPGDAFAITVTDDDGDVATATLNVNVLDDAPVARNDTDTVPSGSNVATGNVMTGADTTSGAAGADTVGADNATLTGIHPGAGAAPFTAVGAGGTSVVGQFGTLTINANGTYSYAKNVGAPGGSTDVFTYRLTDGDGDTADATLTITVVNAPPVISGLTPSGQGGDAIVDEDDLVPDGSDPTKESTTVGGSFTIAAPDGVDTLTIGGVLVIDNGVFLNPPPLVTGLGNTLTFTGYNAATGVVSYTYTLNDNETHPNANGENSIFEDFAVSLTDNDGETDTDTLSVQIVDDVPTANDDADSLPAGTFGPATGNVITDAEGDGGADVLGADRPVSVVGVAAGDTETNLDSPATVGAVIQGAFGKLTLNADGSYSYVRDPGTPGGFTDIFTYTVEDSDGDQSNAELVITAGSSPPVITGLNPLGAGGDTIVDEDDLVPDGSDPVKESTTVSGDFTISAPDEVDDLVIGGVTVISNGAFTNPPPLVTGLGNTLTFTGYNAATGVVSYSYTLNDNEAHPDANGENSIFEAFAVTLTDNDGETDTDTLSVQIVDDVPTANDDVDSLPAGSFGPATGNVITDAEGDGGADTLGADRPVNVVGVAAGDTNANLESAATVGAAIQGSFGKLTLNADGSYSYTRDPGTPGGFTEVFTYTVEDSDGDQSNATLTITSGNTPPIITNLTPSAGGGDVLVDEDDLVPDGSDPTKESTTVGGSFNINAPDGVDDLVIGGVTVISNGVFTNPPPLVTGLGNTLTFTGYNSATGEVSYTYTLTDNEAHPDANGQNSIFEDFSVVLTDLDGESDTDTLSVNIVDDVPTAADDADTVPSGSTQATGNVITDAEGDGGADTLGADRPVNVVGVQAGDTETNFESAGTVGVQIQGLFGKLTLNANGSYTYTRDPGTPGGSTDVFTYTIEDSDGDQSNAELVITIDNAPPVITGLVAGGDAIVDEDDLVPDGSDPVKESTTVTGDLTISAPDGVDTLTIGGVLVIDNGVFTNPPPLVTTLGNTLTFTGYNAATGVVSYSYTLNDNETHPNANGENSIVEDFSVVLTDTDGETDTDTLTVQIVDDVPTANDDTDTIPGGGTSAAGNVITDAEGDGGADTLGADRPVNVVGVAAGDTEANLDNPATVGVQIQGSFGKLTINADGSYTYARDPGTPGGFTDIFTYTIEDSDGDQSNAELVITAGNTPPVITNLTPAAGGGDASVDEDDLDPDGSDPTKESTTVGGSFNISAPDGVDTLTIGGVLVIDNGAFTNPPPLVTGFGNTLTFTGYNSATGEVSYSYTLNDNEAHPNAAGENSIFEDFSVVLTDTDGETDTDTLSVEIVDDVPTAQDDTDTVASGSVTAGGNVITDAEGDGGADTLGADRPVNVVGVQAGDTNTNFESAATVGAVIQGTFGDLTLNADGSYTYTRDPGVPNGSVDIFTYTIEDSDGDQSNATLTITTQNSPPVITGLVVGGDALVDEDDLVPDGSDPVKESTTVTGDFTISAPDGVDTLTIGGVLVINNGVFTNPPPLVTGLGNTLTFTGYNAGTGQVSYSYTLTDNEAHPNALGENSIFEDFSVVLTDNDGETDTDTLSVEIVDDVPTAVDDADTVAAGGTSAGGNVITDAEGDGGADTRGADRPVNVVGVAAGDTETNLENPATVGVQIQGAHGKLTVAADGTYTYARDPGTPGGVTDTFTYTIEDSDGDQSNAELVITIANATPVVAANALVQLDDDALAGGNPGGVDDDPNAVNTTGTLSGSGGDGPLTFAFQTSGAPAGFTYQASGNDILVKQGVTTVLTITLNTSTGAYTVTQNAPIVHAAGLNENNQGFTLNYTVTDVDADSQAGTLSIDVDDDSPDNFTPEVAVLINDGAAGTGDAETFDLNFFEAVGADFTPVSAIFVDTNPADNLLRNSTGGLVTSGGENIILSGFGTSVLTGRTATTNQLVVTVTLNPSGTVEANDLYTVDFDRTLDDGSGVKINTFSFVRAGNQDFNSLNDVNGAAANSDLLFSSTSGVAQSTVNTNSTAVGVANQSMNDGETLRIDFVNNLTLQPAAGNVSGYDYDQHFIINNFNFAIVQKGGSTANGTIDIYIRVYDANNDPDTGSDYGALTDDALVNDPTTEILVNGVVVAATFVAGKGYLVENLSLGDVVTTSTDTGYNRIEIENASGAGVQAGDSFDIGQFGFNFVGQGSNQILQDLTVQGTDGDGDTATGVIKITTTPVPPVALDLDGDGLEFIGTGAGAAFDFNGDGSREATAWVAPDDGLLVHDANGDRVANDGSEIVFSVSGSTDLEGLRQQYDSNGDGLLTAADTEFAKFGVWQDVNSDGVTDAGEFRSLAEMGIVSIDLTSDGIAYSAAGGEVQVSGQSSYSRADGSTGIVGDIAFANRQAANDDQKAAAQSSTQALTSSLVAASLVATVGAAAQPAAARSDAGGVEQLAPSSQAVGASTEMLSRAPGGETREAVIEDAPSARDSGARGDTSSHSPGSDASDGQAKVQSGEEGAAPADLLPDTQQPVAPESAAEAAGLEMSAMPVIPAGQAASAAPEPSADLAAVLTDALPPANDGADIDALLEGLPSAGGDSVPLQAETMGMELASLDASWAQFHQIMDTASAAQEASAAASAA